MDKLKLRREENQNRRINNNVAISHLVKRKLSRIFEIFKLVAIKGAWRKKMT